MTYYRIFTTEADNTEETTVIKSNNTIQQAKNDYAKTRLVQSQKGFKRPFPKEIVIVCGY